MHPGTLKLVLPVFSLLVTEGGENIRFLRTFCENLIGKLAKVALPFEAFSLV